LILPGSNLESTKPWKSSKEMNLVSVFDLKALAETKFPKNEVNEASFYPSG